MTKDLWDNFISTLDLSGFEEMAVHKEQCDPSDTCDEDCESCDLGQDILRSAEQVLGQIVSILQEYITDADTDDDLARAMEASATRLMQLPMQPLVLRVMMFAGLSDLTLDDISSNVYGDKVTDIMETIGLQFYKDVSAAMAKARKAALAKGLLLNINTSCKFAVLGDPKEFEDDEEN